MIVATLFASLAMAATPAAPVSSPRPYELRGGVLLGGTVPARRATLSLWSNGIPLEESAATETAVDGNFFLQTTAPPCKGVVELVVAAYPYPPVIQRLECDRWPTAPLKISLPTSRSAFHPLESEDAPKMTLRDDAVSDHTTWYRCENDRCRLVLPQADGRPRLVVLRKGQEADVGTTESLVFAGK